MAQFRILVWILSLFCGAGNSALAIEAGLSQETKLPLAYHHQEHELSCEAAALKMVFDYFGLAITESEILKAMPFDHTVKRGGIWGDPDAAFVGDVDGTMGKTGYGMYWKALARVAATWKRAEVLEHGELSELTAHLVNQRPIIVWGYHRSAKKIRWHTPAGREVVGLVGEHTRIVYGFRGEPQAPAGFFVMDPLNGPRFWKTADFLRNWDAFGRKGVVLYKE